MDLKLIIFQPEGAFVLIRMIRSLILWLAERLNSIGVRTKCLFWLYRMITSLLWSAIQLFEKSINKLIFLESAFTFTSPFNFTIAKDFTFISFLEGLSFKLPIVFASTVSASTSSEKSQCFAPLPLSQLTPPAAQQLTPLKPLTPSDCWIIDWKKGNSIKIILTSNYWNINFIINYLNYLMIIHTLLAFRTLFASQIQAFSIPISEVWLPI